MDSLGQVEKIVGQSAEKSEFLNTAERDFFDGAAKEIYRQDAQRPIFFLQRHRGVHWRGSHRIGPRVGRNFGGLRVRLGFHGQPSL